jgi:hypothetical protein
MRKLYQHAQQPTPRNLRDAQMPATPRTDLQRRQLAFWSEFAAYVDRKRSPIGRVTPVARNWISLGIGRSGFSLAAAARGWTGAAPGVIQAEVVLIGGTAKRAFDLLLAQRRETEAALGFPLRWENKANTLQAKVYVSQDACLIDRTSWPETHAWLLAHLERLRAVFQDRIRQLSLPVA